MRTNLDYMAVVPEQFKGERETQRLSNQRAAEKVEPRMTLDWIVKQIVGSDAIGLAQIKEYIADQANPFTYVYGNVAGIDTPATDGLIVEMQSLIDYAGVSADRWEEFQDSIAEFLVTIDESNSESLMTADRWVELDVEDNSWSDPKFDPYMATQFDKDVETDEIKGETRWVQINGTTEKVVFPDGSFDFPKYTVGSTNWGFYNEAATEGYRRELMRIRWFANMLLVGGVQIKSDGLAKCGVSGCTWTHQLRSSLLADNTGFDRTYAEYQVLLILAHLGEHTRKNPANYWTPIDRVKVFKDSAKVKLESAVWATCQPHPHYRVKLLKMLVD